MRMKKAEEQQKACLCEGSHATTEGIINQGLSSSRSPPDRFRIHIQRQESPLWRARFLWSSSANKENGDSKQTWCGRGKHLTNESTWA